MRFLIDAQLPPALARWLVERGHDAEHVADGGLLQAADRDIWLYAIATSATIVTKDEGFVAYRTRAANGPSIIWIRRGNVTRRELLRWIEPLMPEIINALTRGETLIEVQ